MVDSTDHPFEEEKAYQDQHVKGDVFVSQWLRNQIWKRED